ncbi:MAG TPA: FAD-binding oxidoreductase [Devosia sp.]|nr:FAD-binding oxidoreductase [Devosia sp.]
MSPMEYDVAVIGGGLHGLSAALHLARRKRKVVIIERRWIGRHASSATAAGVRSLSRDPAEIALSRAAMEIWHRIDALVSDDCGFHANGQIRVAKAGDVARLEARQVDLLARGWSHERLVEGAELKRLLPGLAPDYVAGLFVDDDGSADPHRTLIAFRKAAEGAGATILQGIGVDGAEPVAGGWRIRCGETSIRAAQVVNAAGAWAAEAAGRFGDPILLGTKASMMMVTERVAPMHLPVIAVVGQALSLKQTNQGTLLLGGGLQGRFDLAAERSEVRMQRLAEAARTALAVLPHIGKAMITRTWAGLEAATPDLLPIIGHSLKAPGLIHAFGFSGHGFALVPIMGRVLADLVIEGRTEFDLTAFSPARAGVAPEAG